LSEKTTTVEISPDRLTKGAGRGYAEAPRRFRINIWNNAVTKGG